jgi:hypothetical protein
MQHYVRWDVDWRADGIVHLEWLYGCPGRTRKATFAEHPFAAGGILPLDAENATAIFGSYMTDDSREQALMQDAYASLYDRLDVGTFMGEFASTIDLLFGVRKRILRQLRQLPKAIRNAKLAREAKQASQWLLEWNFGWMSIWRDIEAAYEALNSSGYSDLFIGKASDQAPDELVSADTWSAAGYAGERVLIRSITSVETSLRAGVAGKLRLGKTRTKQPFFNPVISGYELIPYSWLLDYFFSLGSAIKAAFADLQLGESTSAISYLRVVNKELSTVDTDKGSLVSYEVTANGHLFGAQRMRIPRGLRLTPRLTGVPGAKQLLNVIALLFVKLPT